MLSQSSKLFFVLDCAELKKKKLNPSKPLDFVVMIKVSKNSLNTKAFQDEVISQIVDLLLGFFSIFSRAIAFPELILPATITLKHFNKNCKVPHIKQRISHLVEQLEKNSSFVVAQRRTVDFAPKDTDKVSMFLSTHGKSSLEQYFEQHKKNEEKLRALRQHEYSKDMENNDDTESEGDEEIDENSEGEGDMGSEEEQKNLQKDKKKKEKTKDKKKTKKTKKRKWDSISCAGQQRRYCKGL